MIAKKYVKKPVVIEAIELKKENIENVILFLCGGIENYNEHFDISIESMIDACERENGMVIETLEGNMKAMFGDYIIKGINGEFYPCKRDIFHKTYDEVE